MIAHRPRRLVLPASLRDDATTPGADYALYQAFAAALLRGRCRVCNRETGDVHAALRVPMCACRCARADSARARIHGRRRLRLLARVEEARRSGGLRGGRATRASGAPRLPP
jgi:hypothetical protein